METKMVLFHSLIGGQKMAALEIIENEFKQSIATKQLGQVSEFLKVTTSTNDIAWEMFSNGSLHGTLIVAGEQTKGRGRRGRQWISPSGGLWCSLLLYAGSIPRITTGQLPLIAGVATALAIQEFTPDNKGVEISLKWPNDLIINNKKFGGILAESRSNAIVLGIGINCNLKIEDLSYHLQPRRSQQDLRPTNILFPATSLLEESKQEVNIGKLLAAILLSIETWLSKVQDEGFQVVISRWKQISRIIGKTVKINTGTQTIEGVVSDLDESGALIVKEPQGTYKTIVAGDVEAT